MEVEIKNLESSEFREALTRALAGSVVGDVVLKMIQNAMSDYNTRQMIEGIVRDHMRVHAMEIIKNNQEFQTMLKAKVEGLLTESLLDDLVSKVKVDRY